MNYHIIPVTTFNQNCSIIWCSKTHEAAIIDPGGDEEKIKQEIKTLKVTVMKILLTHGHLDHVGKAVSLSKYYNVSIIGPHINDMWLLLNLPTQCKKFNVEYISPMLPNTWLSGTETINIGRHLFYVLHCPGHSPGHVIFLNKEKKFVITGDVLFKNSIGRTDLPGGNFKILMNSIYTKLMTLHNDTVFLPGHGEISTIGYVRYNNPFVFL